MRSEFDVKPVGFIGLGRMGAAIARRMVMAGVEVAAWNRSRSDRIEDLVRSRVKLVDTSAEALARPISFSMLADDVAADEVLSASNIGLYAAGRIHVNMASRKRRHGGQADVALCASRRLIRRGSCSRATRAC